MPTTDCVWVIVAASVGDGPSDAVVHHLDHAARGDHDVGRLDVAVHDAHAVAVVEGVEDVLGDADRLERLEGAPLAQLLPQGVPVDVLHDDVRHGRGLPVRVVAVEGILARVEDGHDRGMVEPGRRLGLAPEAHEEVLVSGEVGSQDLDGDLTPETRVVTQVHVGHAAAADEVTDLVASAENPGVAAHGLCLCSVGTFSMGWDSSDRVDNSRQGRQFSKVRPGPGRGSAGVGHHLSTACMTARAIGAATLPPPTSLPGDAAVLDDDRDGHLGVAGRGEADEPGMWWLAWVVLGRTGLSGDGDAADLGPRTAAVVDDRHHHLRDDLRRPG